MIRKAEKRDISEIMRLLVQVNDVHAAGRPDLFVMGHTKYTEKELEEILKDPSTPVFVDVDEKPEEDGEDGARMLGYCFCVMQDNTHNKHLQPIKTLYIDDLCVDEATRGKHVGRRLYEYVREYAKGEGCYNLTLNVWECNPSAMRFYRSLGLSTQKTGMETLL